MKPLRPVLLPGLGALLLAGSGVAALAAPGWAADAPTCNGKPATVVVTAEQTGVVEGTAGDDVIYVTGAATVHALAGNDVVCGSLDAGTKGEWDGGEGDDTLVASSASVLGGAGNDTLQSAYGSLDGGAGNDVLHGGDGPNTLLGGEGDDQLWGGAGTDVHVGGLGNDVLHTSGRDQVRVGAAGARTTIDATARTIVGPDGQDSYVGSPVFDAPGDTDEVFVGSNRADVFTSAGGHDRVYGQGGNDRLTAVHASLLDGGPGADVIEAWFGGTVKGGSGDDVIRTKMDVKDYPGVTVEPFSIEGSSGADVFFASSYANGAAPVATSDPAQQWTGKLRGGTGRDRLVLSPIGLAVDANMATGKATWTGGTMTIGGLQVVWGTKANDVLTGNGAANGLLGGRGDDTLVGNGGRDDLTGSQGYDTADGGTSRDRCRTEVRVSCER